MKIKYEFDPYEDKDDLLVFQNASNYYVQLIHIRDYIRSLNKYDERDLIPKEEIVDNIYEILGDI